jgi:hypothetical protein
MCLLRRIFTLISKSEIIHEIRLNIIGKIDYLLVQVLTVRSFVIIVVIVVVVMVIVESFDHRLGCRHFGSVVVNKYSSNNHVVT